MRVAVIGAGISGMTAAYLMHQQAEVHLFEREIRLGGHTNTVEVLEQDRLIPIDTGFIVYNDKTYPNYRKLLERLGVASQKTTMSFSVANVMNGLEYNGTDFNGLFAQRKNIINFKFLKMIAEIVHINRLGKAYSNQDHQMTLREFCDIYHIRRFARDNYLIPICSAIWSTPRHKIMETPASFLFKFLENHGMLNINDRPQWYVVKNGSYQYIKKLEQFHIDFHRCEAVTRVKRVQSGVEVNTVSDSYHFDYVVMSTHADDTLALLDSPTNEERKVIAAFPYEANEVILHTDTSVLPKQKRAWACWNFRVDEKSDNTCRLSYLMNMLQSLAVNETYIASVNMRDIIDDKKIIASFGYKHPIYTIAGYQAQSQHEQISGKDRIFYCGAYWRNGFHEDGVVSALHVSKMLGGMTL